MQINYWKLPIENAKTLNELDERTKNFYCEIVLSMKDVEIKDALYRIERIKKKIYLYNVKSFTNILNNIKVIKNMMIK